MKEELKVIITAELSKFKKEIDDGKKKIKTFKDHVKDAGAEMDNTMKKAGESVANGAKAMAVGVAAAGAAMVAVVANTKEYRQTQAQLKSAFEAAGAGAKEATQTYEGLYRVLGDSGQAGEAAQHLAKLTTNEKDLSQWTNICQGVYATFGASLPIESLTEAANETAKTGALTGALADSLNWAGINEEKFQEQLDACNTEAEREALIRETLNGLYSDASAKYEENNASILAQNEAQAQLDASLSSIATTLEPLVAKLTELASVVLAELASKLEATLGFIQEHKTLLAVMAGIIGGIVTAIGLYNAVAAIKAAMDAAQVTTIWGLVAAHTAQAAAAMVALAPYLLIVAAIAAVIAIIVLCIKHWDDIVAAVKKAFEFMKDIVQKGIDAIVQFFQNVIAWIKENWQGLLLILVNPFAAAFKLLYDNCEGFRNTIDNFVAKIKEAIRTGFDWIKNKIITPIAEAFTNVKNTFTNIVTTIKEKLNIAKDAVKSIIDKIKGFFKFEWSLPKLKVPRFSISPAGWKIGDLLEGSIPKLSVSWNARGGVFDKPTIMAYGGSLQGLGENGAEAVVPLENNLEWLDKLATMLNNKMGGGRPLVLKVGEKVFAETTFNAWNSYVEQTGTIPVKVW